MIWWIIAAMALAASPAALVLIHYYFREGVIDETEGLEEWSGALPDTIIELDCFAPDSQTKAVRITQRIS